MREIGVVGAGTIGVGVAQTLAQCGYRVVLIDLNGDILDRARSDIRQGLRLAALLNAEVRRDSHDDILSRIEFTTDYDRLRTAELVVENSTEDWLVKESVYPLLDRTCPADCILAANTSAIPIGRLAALTGRPDRVIGMHFMNPVPRKPAVEVVRGLHTSEETMRAARSFLDRLSKRAIVVNDRPGFVSSRVLMLTINEAVHTVHENVATPGDVDAIFVQCFAHKMGPLATADLIGLDTVLRTLDVLHESFADSKFRPCPLLRQMVDAGLVGRKAGKGFFTYG